MSVTAVLVLLLCCWSLSLADDAAALNGNVALAGGDADVRDDVATLLDRMNILERRVVREQDHLKARLLSQESLNQDLTTKLLRHENTLTQQQSLNRELTTRLARQDGMLLQQGRLIQQLQSAAVSRASTTASRASATVSRASATASHDDIKDATDSETPDSGSDSPVSGHNVTKLSDAAHSIAKRSDDGGPLEAVVNQISQRVTEQGAELQALKAQTTADLNALKVQTNADVQTLQNSDKQQETTIQDARTSIFVRWGSSHCSASSSLVYSGVVGGSYYDNSGAATNFLCLTMSPVFSQHAPLTHYAVLFGAEYETYDSHQNKDPLCAVCRAAFSTTVMVPGTDTCSAGWHLNYSGYLMAGANIHTAGSEYICVDSALHSAPHGGADDNGKLLYYTVTRCGSLPCGPYVNNKVVTCAVCSK